MKKFLLSLILLPTLAFGLGDLAHNYVAERAATQVASTDVKLQSILTVYRDAYLVGSDYPDTGYVDGFNYGEDSHWPYFVNPFAQYIKKHYSNPNTQAEQIHRDKLIAFLLGVATHVKSDIVSHWTYYDYVALHDFGSKDQADWSKAHSAMDPASDFYVIVRKGIYNHPVIWWVPVADLVKIYKIMKDTKVIKETVTAKEIIEANAIYYIAMGLTENIIAYPAYAYDAYYRIPWGIKHLDDPNPKYGAFPEMARQSAQYMQSVWQNIQGQSPLETFSAKKMDVNPITVKLANFVRNAIKKNWLTIQPKTDKFGDVIFDSTSIQFTSEKAKATFQTKLKNLFSTAKNIKVIDHGCQQK